MRILNWTNLTEAQRKQALARPAMADDAAIQTSVASIVLDVKTRGDEALREYSLKFDGGVPADFRVTTYAIVDAVSKIDPKLLAAIKQAQANIKKFHEAEQPKAIKIETMPGVTCEQQWRALDTVGLYIPAGTAPLFSTVLMLALPARIAGCRRIVLCTPAKNGVIHPAILAAAHLCGLTEIFAVGGAQAVAAMAYGTATIPKADKIFGPGNAYVTSAKQLVAQDADGAAIDMPAGPSEVMVVADGKARPDWVASDLLAQCEHDTLAQAILVTTDAGLAEYVQAETEKQLVTLSRQAIAKQSLEQSRIIVVPDHATAIDVANTYAPEHLIIHNDDAADWVPQIRNAGSIFVGVLTPESAGDYASGTNHVLPTYGYARAYSGVNLLSFLKSMTVQTITRSGLQNLGPTIIAMAEAEGLDAHSAAVKIRLEKP
jgi:histidinol dehydrogenase